MKKIFILVLCLGICIVNARYSIKADHVKGWNSYFINLKKCAVQDDVYKIEGRVLDSDSVSSILYKIGTVDTDFTTIKSSVASQNGDDLSLNVKLNNQKELEEVLIEFEIIDNRGISNLVQLPLSDLKDECTLEENVIIDEDTVQDEVIDETEGTEKVNLDEKVLLSKEESEVMAFENERSNELAITNIDVKKNSSGVYTVNVIFNAPNGVASVKFPTWTIANGQDDLIWADGVITGNTASYTVDIKDHEFELGIYLTHVYVYDNMGNDTMQSAPNQTMSNEAPVLSDIKIDNSVYGQYTITATVTDDYGIDRVEFPTWTVNNGQDDLIWERGTISGDTVTYIVKKESHLHELGAYITHIYTYDKAGLLTTTAIPQQIMEESKIEIKNVKTNLSAGRYTITANVASNDVIDSVQLYTWTESNGQDDITNNLVQINGDTITYTVDMKDHRYETGIYITHIYATTKAGTITMYAVPVQDVVNEAPLITNIKVIKGNGNYTITANVQDDYALDYVQVHAWTASKGQDDLTKNNVPVDDGVITFTVDKKDHSNEAGTYYTHIYAYDKAGMVKKVVIPTQVILAGTSTTAYVLPYELISGIFS